MRFSDFAFYINIENKYNNQLLEAVETRDLSIVKQQCSTWTSWLINDGSYGKYRALNIAFSNGDYKIVDYLWDNGVSQYLMTSGLFYLNNIFEKWLECNGYDCSPTIASSTVIKMIKSCLTNFDSVHSQQQGKFKYFYDGFNFLSLLFGIYPPDSAVIKTFLCLLEPYIIEVYKIKKRDLIRVAEKKMSCYSFYTETVDQKEEKRRANLIFLSDAYQNLVQTMITCHPSQKLFYLNSLSNLLKIFPRVDICNIECLEVDSFLGIKRKNIDIRYLIEQKQENIVDLLMVYNTYSIDSREMREIIYSSLTSENLKILPIIMKNLRLKPNSIFVLDLLKKYMADNKEEAVIRLIDFMGLAAYFPEWRTIVESKNLSDEIKQQFTILEKRLEKCNNFSKMSQTCHSFNDNLLSIHPRCGGGELMSTNKLSQLSLFAVVRDVTCSDPKILEQYQKMRMNNRN